MPEMINPETGETKEVSMEELTAAMREGRVSVRQEVHHADGSVTSSMVFGNADDGVDRSVNVFGTMSDVLKPAVIRAQKVQEEDPDTDKVFRMDNTDADYEVTFDDTALPVMHIVSCTKDSVQVRRYTRDERRSVGKPMAEAVYPFVEGKLSATVEDVHEDAMLLFAFAAPAIRALLEERGLLPQLRELDNRGSGVILAAKDDGIDARVVCGHGRPELPCMLFGGLFAQGLQDAVMMRPYVDELMDDTEMSIEDAIAKAEQGDADCMERAALAYLNGDEVEQSPEKAVYWFTKLAQQDNANAQFNLGLHLAKGYGTKRDFAQAAYWMQRAADNGDTDAPALVERYTKAAEAEKKLDSGDAQAQADLAAVLMELAGSLEQAGTGSDYAMAFDLAQKAAEQNNGDGIWILALAYEHGRGVRKNRKRAAALYRQGAELGHAACQHSLACCYMNGDVLPEDHDAAFALMQKSAAQGYGLAMKDLGRCYQFGTGCTGNMQTALEWYTKAAEVLHDPELDRRVEAFQALAKGDPHWGEDYPGDSGGDDMPAGVFDASAVMRENLKAAGKDADDAALANMSLDEAYAALTGQVDMDGEIPTAQPLDDQHSHLDFQQRMKMTFSVFGGAANVNQTGTEYAFEAVEDMAASYEEDETLVKIYGDIVKADTEPFDLAETAHQMAALFRVDMDYFDMAHDREQEIEHGYIQRCITYHALRSFAWTLAAYCGKKQVEPAALSYDTIEELLHVITDRNYLNYTGGSYSPVLCSGDDIHIFYVPDAVSAAVKKQLKLEVQIRNEDNESGSVEDVRSLEGLRRELAAMYPAMQTIYHQLEMTRNHEEALTGEAADVLYAWCAMTYAARRPIFSEDGPATCWWEHPEEQQRWERQMKIEQLENAIAREKDWLARHSKDLSKNVRIAFSNKAFVFVGVDHREEWLDILQAVVSRGGLQRTAVSGKTDYLVCDPVYAGDSQVKRALEQRLKGKNVQIILLAELLSALHMTVKSPQEELAELRGETQKTPEKTETKPAPVPVPAAEVKLPEELTYAQGIKYHGDGYEFDIPDGFTLDTAVEDRAFVAYLPSEADPDDFNTSRFIIFAGEKNENDLFARFRTMAEFCGIAQALSGAACDAMGGGSAVKYERPDLPGAIGSLWAEGTLHAILTAGVDDHLQCIRVQIDGVDRKNRAGYEALTLRIFDHMRADKPVTLLEQPDAEKYVHMALSGKLPKEWADCVTDHVEHGTLARSITQNLLVKVFQQSGGAQGVPKLRKDLKNLLQDTSADAEAVLKKAEYVYTLKRAQYPEHKALAAMKEALMALADFADQTVTLDDRPVEVRSAYAARVKERLGKPVHQAIESLLAEEENGLTAEARDALSAVRAQVEEAHRQAEEKRRAEEAARREAQRKKKEEAAAKAKAEEEARRQAEEAALQKEQEEKRQRAQQIQALKDAAQRAQQNFERDKARQEGEITRRTEQIAALGAERDKLGFLFHLKEKRQIDEKVEALNKEIQEIRTRIDAEAAKAEERIHKLQARADLLSAKKGDMVEFGLDGFDKKTPLVWQVIQRNGDIVELFSRDVICVGSGGDWSGEDFTKKEKDSFFRYKEPTGLWRTSRGFPEKTFSAAELAAIVPVEGLAWERGYNDKYRSKKVTRRVYCPTVEQRKKYDPHFSAKLTANLIEEARKELWEEGKNIRDTQAYFDRNWSGWQQDITAYWMNCEPLEGGFGRAAFADSPVRNGCALGTMHGIRPMVTVDLSKISAKV